jgi:uncharacterized protein
MKLDDELLDVEWDEAKRAWTVARRGIDFALFVDVFDDPARFEREDTRQDYGEPRWVILCPVGGRVYHVTYTLRGTKRRIISVRKANKREQRRYARERQN